MGGAKRHVPKDGAHVAQAFVVAFELTGFAYLGKDDELSPAEFVDEEQDVGVLMIGRHDVAASRCRYILEQIRLPVPYFDYTRARRAESASPASLVCCPPWLVPQHVAAPVSNTLGCRIPRARRRRMRDDQIRPRIYPHTWTELRPAQRNGVKPRAYAPRGP